MCSALTSCVSKPSGKSSCKVCPCRGGSGRLGPFSPQSHTSRVSPHVSRGPFDRPNKNDCLLHLSWRKNLEGLRVDRSEWSFIWIDLRGIEAVLDASNPTTLADLLGMKVPSCLHAMTDPWDDLYIYLHEKLIFMVNVGKYTSPMDPMGIEAPPILLLKMVAWSDEFNVEYPFQSPSSRYTEHEDGCERTFLIRSKYLGKTGYHNKPE